MKTNGYIITILVLSVIMLFIIAGFIVTALYLANGTEASVMNYFKNANYVQKFSLLSKLNQIYPIPEKKASETKIIGSNELLEATPNGRKLGGRNSFNGIPLQLQSDEEIKKLMVNDKFQDEPIFFGVAYSPSNSLEPNCGDKPRDIMLDVAVLSKVTGRIKNYGMQCSQSEYILQAIQDLNLNMTLSMGIWIGRSRTINNSQMKEFKTVIQKYPRHFFESIFIGNEVLFRQDQNEDSLIEYIQEAKSFLISLGYGDIPVGTTEIGSLISSKLVDACDVVGANVHPYFGGVEVKQATNWVYDFLRYQIPAGSSHKIQITEVGWPYEGGKFQNAIADPASFQTFLHDYVCEAYQNEYGWYYFEAFDEPWKKVFYEGNNRWETEWGIFTNDRMIKSGISLPRCQQ